MRIYLAGISRLGEQNLDVLAESRYVLESYYYIKDWEIEPLLNAQDFIFDSGAFSFMSGKRVNDLTDYATRYAKYIKQHRIKKFIELDIQEVFGFDEYRRLDNILCDITGETPIRVFHKMNGLDWWARATKENAIVAYGGLAVNRSQMKDIDYAVMPSMINIAHKNGAWVHGLGFTGIGKLRNIRFDSVDSTSWIASMKYGELCYFDGKKIKSIRRKKGQRIKISEDVRRLSFLEWCKFQRWADDNL